MPYVSKLIQSNSIVINNLIENCDDECFREDKLRLVKPFVARISDDGFESPNSTSTNVTSIYPSNTLDQVTWTFRENNSSGSILGTITGTATDSLTPSGIFTGGTFGSPEFNITFAGNVYVELSATDSAGNVSNDSKTYIDYNIATIVFETTNTTLSNITVTASNIIDIDLGDGNNVTSSPVNHTYTDSQPSHTVTIRAENLSIFNVFSNGVQSIEGLNSSRNTLLQLRCYTNNISTLDVSNLTKLIDLQVSSNNISTLNVSNLLDLTFLYCFSNNISTLDVTNLTNLNILHCATNNISVLDVTNLTSLTNLQCFNNNIVVLDIINLSNLTVLFCYNNNINVLDVTGLSSIIDLHCGDNNISTLNVSGLTTINRIFCYTNNISVLDVTNLTSLTNLQCFNNPISTLNVTNLTNLTNLQCYSTNISVLDVTNLTQLNFLYCFSTSISLLNTTNLNNLIDLRCFTTNISVLDMSNKTSLTRLDIVNTQLPTSQVDQIFSDMVNAPVPNNGTLISGGTTGALTGGTGNADYITLDGNGWTITL